MHTLRGQSADRQGAAFAHTGDFEDEAYLAEPPALFGRTERRLQVRAYEFWAGLLRDARFPPTAALRPETLHDLAPFAVILDFGPDAARSEVSYMGAAVARECEAGGGTMRLADAPEGSLLARIASHYPQIVASEAPVSFESEFVNNRGATIMYRGILLPFSSDGATVDRTLCIVNWKELVDVSVAAAIQDELAASLAPLRSLHLAGLQPASAREVQTHPVQPEHGSALFERLRKLDGLPLTEVSQAGEALALVLVRRDAEGPMMLGEVPADPELLERAARALIADRGTWQSTAGRQRGMVRG